MKRSILFILSMVFAFQTAPAGEVPPDAKRIPTRSEIEEQYRWDLGDIYEDTDAWEKDFSYVEKNIGNLKEYKGRTRTFRPEISRNVSANPKNWNGYLINCMYRRIC
ncbi:MAG: hypothetical protein U5N26_04205 [Candidatus Marinimicrobia bacterium]|nr:hypothetical protein [Candidatus Neomarinimicrobiota bacterium]